MTEQAPKRKKRPIDSNQLAKSIVDIATGEVDDREPTPEEQGKDPAAVSLGRRGGIKGGKARAASMTAKRRTDIAKAAANARWKRSLFFWLTRLREPLSLFPQASQKLVRVRMA